MKDAIHSPHIAHWLRLFFFSACALGMGLLMPRTAAANVPGILTVNSSGDGNTRDAVLTLREAIAIANNGTDGGFGLGRTMTNGEKAQTNCDFSGNDGGDPSTLTIGDWTITGGCGAGIFDNIQFDSSITQVTLSMPSSLQIYDDGTWVNGNAGVPRIDATGSQYDTFYIHASHVTISNISIVNGQPVGRYGDIDVQGGTDSRIAYNYIGTVPGATDCAPSGVTRNAWFGVYVNGDHAGTGDPYGAPLYIYGNVIGCHPAHGISIESSDYVAVGVDPDGTTADGNWLGLNRADVPLRNTLDGVFVYGSDSPDTALHNTIANNIISGNGESGIVIRHSAAYNVVRGNKIGTNSAGTAAIPNGWHGVEIGDGAAHDNTIGGSAFADSNIISGNTQNGVCIHEGPTHNLIANNYIGLSESGGRAVPNGLAGIAILAANSNYVGSNTSDVGAAQFISGNSREGVYITYSDGNEIHSNTHIGVTAWTMMPQGNGREGILLDTGSTNTIVEPSLVTSNGLATGLPGIAVKGVSAGNWIKPDVLVSDNGGLPIDLGDDGATPNGTHSGAGPDHWMNYPTITSAAGSTVTLHACAVCEVRIFRAIGNPAAAGGGGWYLGVVTTDPSGNSTVDLSTLGHPEFRATDITLVAYRSGDGSSEMSPRSQLYLPLIRK